MRSEGSAGLRKYISQVPVYKARIVDRYSVVNAKPVSDRIWKFPQAHSSATSPQANTSLTVNSITPPVPMKLAQRIWKGEYIHLADILPESLSAALLRDVKAWVKLLLARAAYAEL